MNEFTKHKREGVSEMRHYVPGEDLNGIGIPSGHTPKEGDWIARNPKDHSDEWLVTDEYYAENLSPVGGINSCGHRTVGYEFDPSENTDVQNIKSKSAELINVINESGRYGSSDARYSLMHRSIDKIEEACMLAVKSIFVK